MQELTEKQVEFISILVTKCVEKTMEKVSAGLEKSIEKRIAKAIGKCILKNSFANSSNEFHSMSSQTSRYYQTAEGGVLKDQCSLINRPKAGELYVEKYTQEDEEWVNTPLSARQLLNLQSVAFAHVNAEGKFKLPKNWNGNVIGSAFVKDIWCLCNRLTQSSIIN